MLLSFSLAIILILIFYLSPADAWTSPTIATARRRKASSWTQLAAKRKAYGLGGGGKQKTGPSSPAPGTPSTPTPAPAAPLIEASGKNYGLGSGVNKKAASGPSSPAPSLALSPPLPAPVIESTSTSKSSGYEMVVWDCDGVLVDSEALLKQGEVHVCLFASSELHFTTLTLTFNPNPNPNPTLTLS